MLFRKNECKFVNEFDPSQATAFKCLKMIEMREINFINGSIWVSEGDSDISCATRIENGERVVLNIGTFEQLKQWLLNLGNAAVGISIQPYTPDSD